MKKAPSAALRLRLKMIVIVRIVACAAVVVWVTRNPSGSGRENDADLAASDRITGSFTGRDHRLHDEVEQSAAFQQGRTSRGPAGTAHFKWQRKKELLKESYGTEWRTPQEMNPWVTID